MCTVLYNCIFLLITFLIQPGLSIGQLGPINNIEVNIINIKVATVRQALLVVGVR